jgi:MarR family transcriptional regulator, organic hydroperoxide resistance regulator
LRDTLVPLAEEVNEIAVAGVAPATVSATRAMLLTMIDNLAADEARQLAKERRMPSTREIGRRAARRA